MRMICMTEKIVILTERSLNLFRTGMKMDDVKVVNQGMNHVMFLGRM